MNQQKVAKAVEAICATGCVSVNAIIHTLESGHIATGIEDFSDAEIVLLTRELKAIMAVYEARD